MIALSVLDLAPVPEGSDYTQSFANTLDLARHAERLGYRRFWLAEHHNMPGIASAATAVLIGHVAGGTQTIRVGAGGIMLPNHAPLRLRAVRQWPVCIRIESIYVRRAPGTDGDARAGADTRIAKVSRRRHECCVTRAGRPGQAVRRTCAGIECRLGARLEPVKAGPRARAAFAFA